MRRLKSRMRFSEYMNEWLYGERGYYREFRDIGKRGDFYTAVSSSRFFGASIANYLYRLILDGSLPKDVSLIEIGAHRGYLIADMIEWLYSRDKSLIESMSFGIVERQKEVQAVQREYLSDRLGMELEHFSGVDEIKKESIFFVSNEIFDAFGCELFYEGKMAVVIEDRVEWRDASGKIIDFASRHKLSKGEIAVGYEEFAERVAESGERVEFVSFDYGERYVRNEFSIRVYKSHRTFPLFDDEVELKKFFGVSDITYDVNFSHIIESFQSQKFDLIDYSTQAKALIKFGIIDILEEFYKLTSYEDYVREVDRIKTLISPTIMGERFKMINFRI
jgi:SAM-dependent MidA family methyltransferase